MWKATQELYHHGVKGQKWGIRKEEESVGRQPTKKIMTEDEWNDHIVNSYIEGLNSGNFNPDLFARNPYTGNLVSKSYKEYLKDQNPKEKINTGKKVVGALLGGAVGAVALTAVHKFYKTAHGDF